MNNYLNKLTLKQDSLSPTRTAAQSCPLPSFQILVHPMTIVLIAAAITIPLLIEETYCPRIPVDSSDIVSIGHNPQTSKLLIEFKGGRVYRYADVPIEVYSDLMCAESHGKYFNQEIKDAGYEFKQIK